MERTEEDILRYINGAKIPRDVYEKYALRLDDLCTLCDCARLDLFDTVCLIFDYGMAKGYRAAKHTDGKAKHKRFTRGVADYVCIREKVT